MRRNCNLELELKLLPPSASPSMMDMLSGTTKEEQQLTIFYNGQIAVCDATELQARAIILLASREKESSRSPSSSEPSSPAMQSPLYSPSAGLSMKRSLRQFLEKRKNRAQATFPYHHHHRL